MLPTVQLFFLYWLKRKRFQTISYNFNWKIISEQHFALYSNIELLFLYFYTLGEGTVTASWIQWIRLLFIEDILLYSYHRRTVSIIGLYHISNRNIYIQWENTALFLKKKLSNQWNTSSPLFISWKVSKGFTTSKLANAHMVKFSVFKENDIFNQSLRR